MQRTGHFKPVDHCHHYGRDSHAVAADLDGTLLVSRSSFPYFMLVAIEAGSFLRGLLLLLSAPLVLFLYRLVSEAAGIQLLIFVSLAGLPIRNIERVSAEILPRFYAEDVREDSWLPFKACGRKKVVVTANPSVMVRTFVRDCLGGDVVLGTELQLWKGRATGLVRHPGVLVGRRKREALVREFAGDTMPELALGDRDSDHDFMALCKEGYMVPPNPYASKPPIELLSATSTPHFGYLVRRPTPLNSLFLFLWLPLAIILSLLRLSLLILVPSPFLRRLGLLRVKVTSRGPHPPRGSIIVIRNDHLKSLASLVLSIVLGSNVPALQPSGDARTDSKAVREIFNQGANIVMSTKDLLLPMELQEKKVEVGIKTRDGMFRGMNKERFGWTSITYWMMNPSLECEITWFPDRNSQ